MSNKPRMTPYRRGTAAGKAYWAAIHGAGPGGHAEPPAPPACPYMNPASAHAWRTAFDWEVSRVSPVKPADGPVGSR